MIRVLFLPFVIATVLVLSFGYGAWRVGTHAVQRAASEREHALASDLDAQRRLADCYRVGCPAAHRSEVLTCAWRLVIAEETHGDPKDVAEASKDCDGLGERERLSASMAKDELLHRLDDARKRHL
jgi:hypothetical protein